MNRSEILETIAEYLELDSAEFEHFDPLNDSNQAFKLAIDFELDVCLTLHGTKVSLDGKLLSECYGKDVYVAAREAIALSVYKLIRELK